MARQLKQQMHAFLHDYRKNVFELEHRPELTAEREQKVREFVDEVLDQKFHYHLHQKVDEQRVEMIQLIYNYCREAILPPVVQRFAERIVVLERRQQLAMEFVERVIDALADELEHEPIDPLKNGS